MNQIVGIAFLLVAAGMIVAAKPRAGQDHAPFLRSWALGQAYILTILAFILAGAGTLITNLVA